jgi:hypothetical protein
MRFFFYGTLIDADVRRAVLGPAAPRQVEAALLRGWRRVSVPGKTYPIVLADPQASVAGVLARGLTPAARRRLERYEDADLYTVAEVEVVPAGRRRPLKALVFVAKTAAAAQWGRRSATWDLDRWRRRDKRRLLMRLGRGPAA